MKKYLFVLLASAMVFTSCEKKSSVDNRDAFVGAYEYVTEGEMTRSTEESVEWNPTLPLESEGTITITKVGEKDSVLVTGAFNGKIDPFKAVVEGSNLRVVKNQFVAKGSTFEVTLTVDNTIVPLVNDTLTWTSNNVQCEGTMMIPLIEQEITITGQGHVTMKAHKIRLK